MLTRGCLAFGRVTGARTVVRREAASRFDAGAPTPTNRLLHKQSASFFFGAAGEHTLKPEESWLGLCVPDEVGSAVAMAKLEKNPCI